MSRLAALVIVLALSGCQTASDMYEGWFGAGPKQKAAELTQFQPRATARIVWQGNVGKAERNAFYPAVAGNTVYAAGAAGQIAADLLLAGKTERFDAAALSPARFR